MNKKDKEAPSKVPFRKRLIGLKIWGWRYGFWYNYANNVFIRLSILEPYKEGTGGKYRVEIVPWYSLIHHLKMNRRRFSREFIEWWMLPEDERMFLLNGIQPVREKMRGTFCFDENGTLVA